VLLLFCDSKSRELFHFANEKVKRLFVFSGTSETATFSTDPFKKPSNISPGIYIRIASFGGIFFSVLLGLASSTLLGSFEMISFCGH
jgi:hypothetical protein